MRRVRDCSETRELIAKSSAERACQRHLVLEIVAVVGGHPGGYAVVPVGRFPIHMNVAASVLQEQANVVHGLTGLREPGRAADRVTSHHGRDEVGELLHFVML
jgi:hypothetical protein